MSSITVQGLPELQRAFIQINRALTVGLGAAVQYATAQYEEGTRARVHILTGTYADAQTYEVTGLMGSVFTEDAVNPLSSASPEDYGPIEEARGGSHAAYARTFREDTPSIAQEAIDVIVKALP